MVQQLVDSGQITREQAALHPQKKPDYTCPWRFGQYCAGI